MDFPHTGFLPDGITPFKYALAPVDGKFVVTFEDGRTVALPRIKFGVMGRPGSGKSELVASMAKPLKVFATDPPEKLTPYTDRGVMRDPVVGQFGQVITTVDSRVTGKPIISIESFLDEDPMVPVAYNQLWQRAQQLRGEVKAGLIASFGLDSWSTLEDCARQRRRYGAHAISNPDPRGLSAAAKDDIKQLVGSYIMLLPCNVGITFHTAEKSHEEGGTVIYGIKAIGTLPTDIPALIPERYRAEAQADGVTRQLYTRPDGRYDLCTLIHAPSPCTNAVPALFQNWIAKQAAMVAQPAATATAADPAAQTNK